MLDPAEQDRFVLEARRCAMAGFFDGTAATQWLVQYCRHETPWMDTDARIVFTRDVGHHSSGWWKNPDYERCWHLSVSFRDGYTKARGDAMARMFFGSDVRKCWIEPPYSAEGRQIEVWHYRLFCDAAWCPIQPRGEVYTKLQGLGWRSFSEQAGATSAASDQRRPAAA